jgi:AhpD family alkylhydroperoxidase
MATNAPASYTALGKLAEAAEQEAIQSGLEPTVLDLIKIRVSQLNGCAFCLRMHTRESLAAGETSDRLAVLPAWRESQYFNPREQAALSVAEAITMIATTAGDDPAYSFARQHLDDKQLAAVVWVAIAINGYNRVAISGHYHVGNLKQQSHNGIRTSAPPDHFANPRVREIHMKLNRFRTILCAAATALVSASALTVGAGPAAADQLPTVVLVHGAFADTTSLGRRRPGLAEPRLHRRGA